MTSKPKKTNVYVIALDLAVLQNKKFQKANPNYVEGKPCVYVGMTGLTPEKRFAQHKDGYKSSRYPRKYGKYLRRKLYERLNPMTYDQACKEEVQLAKKLRKRGYGVWQN